MEALIIYHSMTGNTLECAEILGRSLKALGMEVRLQEVGVTEPEDLKQVDLFFLGSYTYGYGYQGELPEDMKAFLEDLTGLDLSGSFYGVFGSGDVYYQDFCLAVDVIDQSLARLGGHKVCPSVKVHLAPEEMDVDHFRCMARQAQVTVQACKGA